MLMFGVESGRSVGSALMTLVMQIGHAPGGGSDASWAKAAQFWRELDLNEGSQS